MDLYEALYTTRAMRRVKPDPIPEDVQQRILDAAIRAPTGGNAQGWKFMLVDDPGQREKIGELYRECIDILWSSIYHDRVAAVNENPDAPESKQFQRIINSVTWAQENFAAYPLLFFAFDQADATGGSIFPAVWSAQLQARADGVGSSLTSVLMLKNDEMQEILQWPSDEGWRMV